MKTKTRIIAKPALASLPDHVDVYVNGRFVAFTNRIRSIEPSSHPGEWTIMTTHDIRVTVFGGKAAGATSTEWFVDYNNGAKPITCRSAAEAIRIITES